MSAPGARSSLPSGSGSGIWRRRLQPRHHRLAPEPTSRRETAADGLLHLCLCLELARCCAPLDGSHHLPSLPHCSERPSDAPHSAQTDSPAIRGPVALSSTDLLSCFPFCSLDCLRFCLDQAPFNLADAAASYEHRCDRGRHYCQCAALCCLSPPTVTSKAHGPASTIVQSTTVVQPTATTVQTTITIIFPFPPAFPTPPAPPSGPGTNFPSSPTWTGEPTVAPTNTQPLPPAPPASTPPATSTLSPPLPSPTFPFPTSSASPPAPASDPPVTVLSPSSSSSSPTLTPPPPPPTPTTTTTTTTSGASATPSSSQIASPADRVPAVGPAQIIGIVAGALVLLGAAWGVLLYARAARAQGRVVPKLAPKPGAGANASWVRLTLRDMGEANPFGSLYRRIERVGSVESGETQV
ncbi:hypothetical protein AURDEDRAFT_174116 [Auricularia subglabra TFB-10046 SS5]|nr:hypothetical protein AURDEDRAFT_174116 [Auricularia subglabra TFB-10046 SS5]